MTGKGKEEMAAFLKQRDALMKRLWKILPPDMGLSNFYSTTIQFWIEQFLILNLLPDMDFSNFYSTSIQYLDTVP